MKTGKRSKGLPLATALLLATSAFAAEKASLQLYDQCNVGGTKLKAGEYTLQWEGAGPNVELSFVRGHSVVAKTSARMVDTNSSPPTNTIVTKTNDDGGQSLSQIQLRGRKFALEIGGESAPTETAHRTK